MIDMEKTEFIRCPICGNKTRDKIREDTILKNFPLFCPKCKSECLIDIEQFHITVIKAPDAQPQSRYLTRFDSLWLLALFAWCCAIYIINFFVTMMFLFKKVLLRPEIR